MATHSCSCLENPRDGGAWWAAIYGVAQSGTLLKRLSMHIHGWVGIFRQSQKYGDPESGKLSCICAFLGRVKLLGGPMKHLRSGVLGWVQSFDWWGMWRPGGEGNGTPFQYSCLENPIDRGAW